MVQAWSSATTDTFRGAAGGFVTRAFTQPVNYREANGGWAPIVNTLVPDAAAGPGTVENAANGWHVQLPGSAAGTVGLSDGAQRGGGFSLPGAAAAAISTDGPSATYRGVFADTSVSYEAAAGSVKERIVLASASAPSTFRFALDLPAGWSARLASGTAELLRPDGSLSDFRIAAPTVTDAAPGFQNPFAHVRTSISRDGSGGWGLVVSIDRRWLSSSDRVFPVTVDPTVRIGNQLDCFIASWAPGTSGCGQPYMDVGTASGDGGHEILPIGGR
jgi:hypothetical protein